MRLVAPRVRTCYDDGMSDRTGTTTLTLAPLHGVTGRILRSAWFRSFGGFDAVMAPFLLAVPGPSAKRNHYRDLVPAEAIPVPLVPQILGNDADSFLSTARALRDAGYARFNWNLGCPYPMVTKKFRGAGLLPYPERVDGFLGRVFADGLFARGEATLSVKLRLGLANPGEILALMPALNRHPLEAVILHARIGTQMYRGSVNLEAFEAAAALSARPLAYNGDITGLSGFMALSERLAGVSDWMIGRGALADPFLPARIKRATAPRGGSGSGPVRFPAAGAEPPAIGSPDWLSSIRVFHDDAYAGYRAALCGPSHVLAKMKELWGYLAPSFPSRRRELGGIPRARSFAEYERAVGAILGRT